MKNLNILFNNLKNYNNYKLIKTFLYTLLLFSFTTIILFPFFPDEIQIRMWLSRLPYEFPNRVTGHGRCITSFSQAIPPIFYPAALLHWIIHGLLESVSYLRILGNIILIAWIAVLAKYIHTKYKHYLNFSFKYYFVLIVLLLFIGINPIFISINRSEQFYYPALIFLFLILIYSNYFKTIISKHLITVFSIFLISLFLYGHPKGLFFIPFFCLFLFYLIYRINLNKFSLLIYTIILLYLFFEGYYSWTKAFKCSEIPEYEKFLASFSFDPFQLFYAPDTFYKNVFQSISRFNEYFTHLVFKKNYIWEFLPPIKNFSFFYEILNFLIKTVFVFIYALVPFLTIYYILKNQDQRIFNILLLVLFLCLNLWGIFNLTKNIYDGSFFYTITALIFIFLIAQNFTINNNKLIKIILFYILVVSSLSQSVLIYTNLLPFLKGYTGPGIRIGYYESKNINESIKKAASICKIDEKKGKYIVVDDLTYGFFRKSHGPISYTYNSVGETKTPLYDLFNTVPSDGMILDCNVFPPNYREDSIRSNNICCFSKDLIKKFFIDTNSELQNK